MTASRIDDSLLLERFLEMLSAERGASANTIEAYRRDLRAYGAFLGVRGRNFTDAAPEDVSAHLADLGRRRLSAASQARALSAIRQLHRFLFAEEVRGDDPSGSISTPRRAPALPRSLSVEEVGLLLDTAAQEAASAETAAKERAAVRLHALLETLYATGMRVSELISLPIAAARTQERFIAIIGKGGRERLVPLSDPARQALAAWLKLRERKSGSAGSRFLFPAASRQGHVTRQAFARELRELARRSGLGDRDVSPHVLRHAFASHLLAGGADLRSLQQLLGHSDISTTQIYTHILEERLRLLVEEKHPLARLAPG